MKHLRNYRRISARCLAPGLAVFLTIGCGKKPPDPAAGNAAFYLGRYDQAISEYEKAYGQALPEDESVADRMAICYFSLGKYKEFIKYFNHYLRQSQAFREFKPSRAAVQILVNRQFGALNKTTAINPFLEGRDLPHLLKMRLFHRLALRIVQDRKTEEKKALALFDWVVRNIRLNSAPEAKSFPGSWDATMSGFGTRPLSNWVLVSLAQQMGIQGHVVELRSRIKDSFKIHHTITTLRIDGKWALLDPCTGAVLRDPKTGTLSTLQDILAAPKLLLEQQPPLPADHFKKEFFQNALVAMTFHRDALLPRMSVVQNTVRDELSDASSFPTVFQDVSEAFHQLVRDNEKGKESAGAKGIRLPYTFAGQSIQTDFWKLPFEAARQEAPGFQYFRGLSPKQQQNSAFCEARLHQMLGNLAKAAEQFERIANDAESPLAEDSRYFASVCYYENLQFEKAKESLLAYLKKYAKGVWKDQAHLHLGYALQYLGDAPAAEVHLKQVKGLRRYAATAAISRPKKKIAAEPASKQPQPETSAP